MPGYAVIHPKNNKVLAFVSANRSGMPAAFGRATELAAHYAAKDNMKIAVVAAINNLKKGYFVSDLYWFGGPYVMVDGRLNIYSQSGMPDPTENPPTLYSTDDQKNPGKMKQGLHIEWSPVNQAWFLMWHADVLRVFNDKKEAEMEMEDLLRKPETHSLLPWSYTGGGSHYPNPAMHRTGARLRPNLKYWDSVFHQATGVQEGHVSAVFPYLDSRGNLALFVRVKNPRGFDTWSPYFNQQPDQSDVKAARNDPDGWVTMMEGATEWEKMEWFIV